MIKMKVNDCKVIIQKTSRKEFIHVLVNVSPKLWVTLKKLKEVDPSFVNDIVLAIHDEHKFMLAV